MTLTKEDSPITTTTQSPNSPVYRRLLHSAFALTLLSGLVLALSATFGYAESATWKLNPTSADWNTAANWTPEVVPNGPSDTATFDTSNTTDVTTSANTEVNAIVFNPGASAFTISPQPFRPLTVSGTGIINNSGVPQNFVSFSTAILFYNQATAGSDTFFSLLGGGDGNVIFHDNSNAETATFTNGPGGSTFFFDESSAAEGTFINNGATRAGTGGGITAFFGETTAGDATIISDAATSPGLSGGYVGFFDDSDAGNASITANGRTGAGTQGGFTSFFGGNPGNATLIAVGGTDGGEGGSIFFESASDGGTARVELFGNGNLAIAGVVGVGSIEGDGDIFLGGSRLTVGQNNLNTIFSGLITGARDNRGSLTKKGTGTLTLTNANTYTGGTTISGGQLVVNNMNGSATGTGPVRVNAGTLAGRGTIAGTVIVGTGSGAGAALAPGKSRRKVDILTIQGTLNLRRTRFTNVSLKVIVVPPIRS